MTETGKNWHKKLSLTLYAYVGANTFNSSCFKGFNHHPWNGYIRGSPDNMLHGIVIDNKVCHPKNNDFYLGTHAGMIGITRQTHYLVLLDQARFLANDLQDWGQFIKIKDASETSSSHGGMYAPGVISVPQFSRLKDKVSNFILVC
ncbi:hypothetical protein GOBAR_AA36777 [Gossypium barbadense]|uniref:Piwi domain-containing protein n=1 Tax=Gossypium barbadense TaxID=3634 RepID=A0A2P5VYL5_GOSBA|nr:hypothetical protein GOBAR_AA36777 [Gossypium barbadense]